MLLEIASGSRKGSSVPLKPGVPLRVGRTDRADLCLSDDSYLSGLHFEVTASGDCCVLRDLNSSNGTFLRGTRIIEVRLARDEQFTAGHTLFRVFLKPESGLPSSVDGAALDPPARKRLLAEMQTELQPLYALLDASHDPRILPALMQHGGAYASLFAQGTPPELMKFAPYLVSLPPASPLFPLLLDAGWGNHWGIYLTSTADPWTLLAFLRRLLIADQPDGQQAFLRFYDPRVLRALLTSSTPTQWPHFFGLVRSFLVPGEEPGTAVGFAHTGFGVERYDISLGPNGSRQRELVAPGGDPSSVRGPAADGASRPRLALSAKQATELKQQERDPFVDQLNREMRIKYPERFALVGEEEMGEWIEYGCTRAQRYGFRTQPLVRDYVSLTVRLGRDFDRDPALGWAADILGLRLPPPEKLARLKAAESARL